ncbi:hypothetical protein B5X24_HaOG213481 [Helicoverpa armigera]|uniref:Uncharacterized protein n=1 Tax=Helicoverpa armigera TaxID=29058 RepID=A0A2W1B791_HELAM|nr:hypothetical protein B5X24_HaOG213481 [Helicoverpa armigera]
MVRNYKKKKENDVNEEDAERAVLCVVNDNMKLRTAAAIYNINKFTDDDFECSEVTNRVDPSHVPLIVASENLIPAGIIAENLEINEPTIAVAHDNVTEAENLEINEPTIAVAHDNVTEAENLEINEPTIAVAHDSTDKAQIVAQAPAIDSDATDAEDIEVDQPVIASIEAIDKGDKPTTTLTSQIPLELNHAILITLTC